MNSATYAQLNVFKTVVAEGSLAAAARKLEMAPPSLSKAIKLLEKNVGLSLFDRSARKLILTEAGQMLFDRTSHLLAEFEAAIEEVKDLDSEPSGQLRITLPRLAHQIFFSGVYSDFCQKYPEIKLEVSISDEAIDIVKEGFDFGIRFGDRISDGMIAKQLTQPLKEAIFASPDYIAKHGQPSSLNELAEHKMIQYRFIASNQLAPFKLNYNNQALTVDTEHSIIVNDTDLVVESAKKQLGLGRMVENVVSNELSTGELAPVLQDYWFTYPGLFLYYSQHNKKLKRFRVFLDYIASRIKL